MNVCLESAIKFIKLYVYSKLVSLSAQWPNPKMMIKKFTMEKLRVWIYLNWIVYIVQPDKSEI